MGPADGEHRQGVRGLERRPDVIYTALVLNRKGLERAINCNVSHLSVSISASETHSLLALPCGEPPKAATHWTGRMVAKVVGFSLSAVQRIWAAHRLQPHRIRTFKKSNDPAFAAKVEDIVGLYMNPPKHAIVVSIDEKSQIQALDRTQPGLQFACLQRVASRPPAGTAPFPRRHQGIACNRGGGSPRSAPPKVEEDDAVARQGRGRGELVHESGS
jgi:hypothetical protein